MARRISTGVLGRSILGSIVAEDNSLQSVVTNENIILEPNGTGIVVSLKDVQLNSASSLRLADSDSSNYLSLKAPATVANNITYVLPGSGIVGGYVLQTDASGNLSWTAPSVTITNQTTDIATYYPTITTATSGTITTASVSSTKLTYVPSTGTLTTTALVESSSIALKENVTPIENALETVLKLTGVIYDRKDGSYKNEAGLIAEDVYKILPNLVTTDKEGNPYGINYTKFSAYLIEAVKELHSQITVLKQDK